MEQVERHIVESAKSQRQTKVREIGRLSRTNLADIPREIATVAQELALAARPLAARERNSRPVTPDTIRAEEVALREAVEQEQKNIMAAEASAAAEAQRSSIIAICNAQAAAVGANTYTPYSRRAGILGSALVGAINSSAAEERARGDCYRMNGI
ncbi:hypothetical protein [Muricoccus nepalensis]|uniref:hypothetical protein n=1 Tax=Muricoccus nepalensis TaxID=1854500 RepID=UPI00112648CE|nr:hypothetical protein [Roseomonas nepalensis]